MPEYIIDVIHMDRYEFEAESSEEALNVAKNCVADNYGALYFDGATFNVIRVDIPTVGDATDAGVAGE